MKFYKIEIATLEPIVIGYDNSNESRDIISGTALRGLFIKENIKDFSNKGELILSKDIIFTDAYLKKGDDYFIPTPKLFLCDKHDMKKLKKDKKKQESIDIRNCLFSPDEKFEGKSMTEGIGSRFVNLAGNSLKIASVNKVENMHINKSIKEGTDSLYRYEAIDKGQTFYSLAILKDNELISEDNLKKIKGTKYIGKSRSATYGKIKIKVDNLDSLDKFKKDLKIESIIDDRKTLDIYFLTDTILKDQYGNTCSLLLEEEIEKLFGLNKVETVDSQFVTNKIIGGYNTHQKIALPKDTAIEAGSIIRYRINDGTLTEEKIKDIEENGIGYFRERGFGRVIINPNFEQSKVIKYDDKADRNSANIENPYSEKFEKAMFDSLSASIKKNRELDLINEIITDTNQNLIKVSSELGTSQINSFIIDLSNGVYKEKYGLKKDKLYNDRREINLFGDTAMKFFENIKDKNIDGYLKRILNFKKRDKVDILNREEFIKKYVTEFLYFQLRGKDNE